MTLIYGSEPYLNEEKLNNIKQKFNPADIVVFDSKSIDYKMEEALSSMSLIGNKNLIILNDFYCLFEKNLKANSDLFDKWITIISQSYHEVVIFSNKDSIIKNKFTNFLNEKADVLVSSKINKKDLIQFVINYINSNKGYISYNDAVYLLEMLPENLFIITNEIKKLLNLSKKINIDLIKNNIQDTSSKPFAFLNAIETGRFANIYTKYQHSLLENDNIIFLVSQLASYLTLSSCVYNLKKMNWDNQKIAKELNIHEYRVIKAMNLIKFYGYKKIKNIIFNLAKTDLLIKRNSNSAKIIFENFLIKNFYI
ncbi:hypothetical protein GE118_04285 [Mycoplasma sp. NEAQ87857]|uniref:DNA polymerase III subunit delta n=1 Tax=Mycoplasma sp. NEAQ87857 TaxID=2683967 RepID=UPI0013198769|nr:hypothetical protein [Mycoplasma sp. NEAQ87857]QGZ97994.1 hypothetical protein GE118_04285 [Mycoplasma sp. NEAQ87857]